MANLMLMANYARAHSFDVTIEAGHIQIATPLAMPSGVMELEWHIVRTWKELRHVLGY